MMQETAGGQPLGGEPAPGQEPAIPQAVGDEEQGITQASPEEQAQADHLVGKALELIYSDGMFEQVVNMLEGGAGEGAEGDPGRGLAMATDMIAARVGEAAEQAGEQLSPDVAHAAFGDILEELAEVSRRGQIKDYSTDPEALESSYFQALDLYRERLSQAGVIDQEHAKADFGKLQQMDENGQLERIMRDLAASDRAGPAGGREPPPTKEKKPKGFNAAMGV
jgi:hypothetical protein